MSLHTKELKIFNIQQLTSYSEQTSSFLDIKARVQTDLYRMYGWAGYIFFGWLTLKR